MVSPFAFCEQYQLPEEGGIHCIWTLNLTKKRCEVVDAINLMLTWYNYLFGEGFDLDLEDRFH